MSIKGWWLTSILLWQIGALAQDVSVDETPEPATPSVLEADVQDLKKQVQAINRDLFLLEEELLFPANTQVNVFLSMDVGEFFELDAIDIKIDGKDVAHYLYTEREQEALLRGGVQHLYQDNLKSGEHELVAIFYGTGPNERAYKRATELTFEKALGTKYIELKIEDTQRSQQPEFTTKVWE